MWKRLKKLLGLEPIPLRTDQLIKMGLFAQGIEGVKVTLFYDLRTPNHMRAKGLWKSVYFVLTLNEIMLLNDLDYRTDIINNLALTLKLKDRGRF